MDLLLRREQRRWVPMAAPEKETALWALLWPADDHTWSEADVVCLWKLLGIIRAQRERDQGLGPRCKVLSCNLSISVTRFL